MLVTEQKDGKQITKCRNCGKESEIEEDYKVTEEKEQDPKDRLNAVGEDGDESTRPTTEKECPKCGEETEHEWWMEQILEGIALGLQ